MTDVDAFLYAANHDWAREEQIRRQIAREVRLARYGHPLSNTAAGVLGSLALAVVAFLAISWDGERIER